MSTDAKMLRHAAAGMREQDGLDAERALWSAMADLLALAADHAEDEDEGNPVNHCLSCVRYAGRVASAYLEAAK